MAQRLARVEAELADLRAAFARTRRNRGTRDDADAALVVAVHAAAAGQTFTARDLIDHATVAPPLHHALSAADLTTARELGLWLARLEGHPVGRLVVVCVEEDHDGHAWAIREVGD